MSLLYPNVLRNATPPHRHFRTALCLWLLCLMVVTIPLVGAAEPEPEQTVREIVNAKSMVLEGGEVVRLAALQAPNVREREGKMRPGEPMGEEARTFLKALVLGKPVRLEPLADPRDRHDRIVAQAYLADGRWVQGALLEAGMAMVYPFADSGPKVVEMLALERQARAEKRGIWAEPYYAIIEHMAAGEHTNRFKLVEGVVQEVAEVRGTTYINFGEDWKTDFTAVIPKEDRKHFKKMDAAALKGKRVRVRGWVYFYNGPAIDLTTPGQVEVLSN